VGALLPSRDELAGPPPPPSLQISCRFSAASRSRYSASSTSSFLNSLRCTRPTVCVFSTSSRVSVFATKREGVLVVGLDMVNTRIYGGDGGFAAGVIGIGVWEVGSG